MTNISLYFVRHGQRVDQVDPSWVQTSPYPQDPPLTTLGKMQARQTGRMIRDFARECSSSITTSSSSPIITSPVSGSPTGSPISLQRITPPESPECAEMYFDKDNDEPISTSFSTSTSGSSKRQHHFAIITSPFLRCSETAMEMAMGISSVRSNSNNAMNTSWIPNGHRNVDATSNVKEQEDMVTISVEAGLSGNNLSFYFFPFSHSTEWLSLEYVSEPVSGSIIVQRMQDFAMARRDHEQYYAIDWKYTPKERSLPTWPETHEDMQSRLDRVLGHIISSYTEPKAATAAVAAAMVKDRDLSIVIVTHASPVNALLEACLQTPILVPVPNCSITRCRWTPLSSTEETQQSTCDGQSHVQESSLPDVLMQSKKVQTIAQEQGKWLLDYQTHTSHLDRDRR
ncbi:hypothetical protein BG011_006060 [Mortierella polycephala]|uniref:Phosphoglycerate mutase-like protein n=1 Tax=Mortierella polycephala TaxID=41804 RepID=A0A9P6U938_9FUNG|nr:hypothetical protein BG011_006060 [Mortierella polycephala]